MLLGIRSVQTVLLRHTGAALFTFGTWYLIWLLPSNWSADMRVWRVLGDVGFVLLFLILILGPLAKLFPSMNRFVSWRRELGIWFAIMTIFHTVMVFDGWLKWDVMRFFGYQELPQLGRYSLTDPGFGLANLIGLFAAFWAVVLGATSSDKAVNFFGVDSWKWLQGAANTIFYLVAAHVGYFMFIHYTLSSHRVAPDPNILRWPFLIMAITVFILQMAAFTYTVRKNRKTDWY